MTTAPRITAHRGQSATHPENTIPALREAVRLGADALEFDVQPTADGSIVLMHDRSPLRTTNIRHVQTSKVGLSVQRFTLAELAQLDAGSWKSPAFAGTPVPTLRDVVHALRGTEVRLVVEMKSAPVDARSYVRAVLDELGGHSRVTLMSFDRDVAEAALPVHHAVGLVSRGRPNAADIDRFDEFHVSARRVDRALVDRVHAGGGTLTAWTVDDPRQVERLAALGVDGITTNDVSAARPALV
ncbi:MULTISPECIES: glycerophosphodiester phosphodiesterase [Aeromicrobium]|uniref:glycerophosphodiester phosphodiesterase n=1 Tax=Aeromicrobium TaxID=2040 RepID=UPI00257A25B8|nr:MULTISPECIES: glycerophosphodiester phosphodiesterase family protein [Aeromicrobium]